jgi:hypothetical protein
MLHVLCECPCCMSLVNVHAPCPILQRLSLRSGENSPKLRLNLVWRNLQKFRQKKPLFCLFVSPFWRATITITFRNKLLFRHFFSAKFRFCKIFRFGGNPISMGCKENRWGKKLLTAFKILLRSFYFKYISIYTIKGRQHKFFFESANS